MAGKPAAISSWSGDFDPAQRWLADQILREVRTEIAEVDRIDQCGTRYTVEAPAREPSEKGTVVIGWSSDCICKMSNVEINAVVEIVESDGVNEAKRDLVGAVLLTGQILLNLNGSSDERYQA